MICDKLDKLRMKRRKAPTYGIKMRINREVLEHLANCETCKLIASEKRAERYYRTERAKRIRKNKK